MAARVPDAETVQAVIAQWEAIRGPERSIEDGAKTLGHEGRWLKRYLAWAQMYGLKHAPHRYPSMSLKERAQVLVEMRASKPVQRENVVRLPKLPTGDMPIEELVSHLTKRSSERKAAYDARRWINCDVTLDGPIGLAMIGDPHVDDDGCDWECLNRDLAVLDKHQFILTAGLGDYNNNWVGRLSRLYADQGTTGKEAWQLVKWLVSRLRPFLLIKGNHNLWSGHGDPLDWMTSGDSTITSDWQARISLRFRNGAECRIISAHDFPGSSMWNPLHANMRKAKESGARAHVYVAGHRHTWGVAQHEDPDSNHVYWLARARGYKVIDSHAEQLGYLSQRYGHSVLAVIDPDAYPTPRFLAMFSDLEEGADYLAWKRANFAKRVSVAVDYESEQIVRARRKVRGGRK